jgi:hypothetical protein
MGTVTYPDPSLSELLPKFVLIKVAHDAEPALVKQFGVQPLPDLRLLAPDGKEIDKLVGFTSAKKLAGRLQSALDRIAGQTAGPADEQPAAGRGAERRPDVEPTPDAVRLAVMRGCSFLRGEWRKGWKGSSRFLPDELVLYAWSSAGLGRTDADAAALLSHLLESPPAGTYRAALRACALERLAAPDLRPRLEECARYLQSTQLANGQWSYGPDEETAQPSVGDNSNSAYALLGLSACRRAGVEVSRDVMLKAAGWWIRSQNDDGGFGYRSDRESTSYESMTASGLHGLLVAFDALGRPPKSERARAAGESTYDFESAILRGGSWLASHFNVRENEGSAYQGGRLLYGLYAIERTGDTRAIDAPRSNHGLPADWYRQGAAFLLSSQRDDGSWDDGSETPVPNTCFALLFLTRATAESPPN